MGKNIRYTNDGHRFEIDGILDVGYTITITVIPNHGYEFITWLTHPEKFIEIEKDENNNKRFTLTIDECGVVFSGLFQPVEIDNETNYYFETLTLEEIPEYINNHTFYTQVNYSTNTNFTIPNLKALTFIGIPDTITTFKCIHKTNDGFQYKVDLNDWNEGLPIKFKKLYTSFQNNNYKTFYILTGDGQNLEGELIITLNK